MRDCPKCGAPMERQEHEPDVNVTGGWMCTDESCGEFVLESEDDWSDDCWP